MRSVASPADAARRGEAWITGARITRHNRAKCTHLGGGIDEVGTCFAVVAATIAAAQGPSIQPLPTPRLSDGKPDLTGVYQASNRRGPEWDAQVPGEVPWPAGAE